MSAQKKGFRSTADILACKPAESPWLWEGYLAKGAITVFSSGVRLGKSTLLSLLLNAMQKGGRLADAAVKTAPVFVTTEEPDGAWHPRIAKFGLSNSIINVQPFLYPPSQDQWVEYIKQFLPLPPSVAVFDSLTNLWPAAAEHCAKAAREAEAGLRALAQRGWAVMATLHPSKHGAYDFNFRGHIAAEAGPEILMELKMPYGASPTDRRRILQVRTRMEIEPPRRMLELNPEGTVYTVVEEPPVETAFEYGWGVLKMILEDTDRLLTVDVIEDRWPRDYCKPSSRTLRRWMEQAFAEGKVERLNTGRPFQPFLYALPGSPLLKLEGGEGDPYGPRAAA